jgi:hypothetical protein
LRAFVLAGALAISACTAAVPPVVSIAPGLHPTLTPAQAERFARDAIAAADVMASDRFSAVSVTSITAIPGGPTVGGYLAGTSWIITARGAFVEPLGRFAQPPTRPRSGIQLVISDDGGEAIAFNFTN